MILIVKLFLNVEYVIIGHCLDDYYLLLFIPFTQCESLFYYLAHSKRHAFNSWGGPGFDSERGEIFSRTVISENAFNECT